MVVVEVGNVQIPSINKFSSNFISSHDLTKGVSSFLANKFQVSSSKYQVSS